jgi:6-pyruvoyltetrahydropterin/6-carboxytetrahydropterin synthase
MATFAESIEALHGHNYAVSIEVEGALQAEGWVTDFGVLKRIGRDICDRLDHHFLLQATGDRIDARRDGEVWELRFREKRYEFPANDVFLLPIANTTAELIAEWFWSEVLDGLRGAGVASVRRLTIGVEEAPGQAGWFSAPVPSGETS